MCVCYMCCWHAPAPTKRATLVQDGATPLAAAADRGHVETVRALLGAGANKDAAMVVSRSYSPGREGLGEGLGLEQGV